MRPTMAMLLFTILSASPFRGELASSLALTLLERHCGDSWIAERVEACGCVDSVVRWIEIAREIEIAGAEEWKGNQ